MKYVDLECRYTRLARATSLSLLSSLWRWRAEGLPSTLACHSTAPEVLYSPYSLPPTSLRPPNRLPALHGPPAGGPGPQVQGVEGGGGATDQYKVARDDTAQGLAQGGGG